MGACHDSTHLVTLGLIVMASYGIAIAPSIGQLCRATSVNAEQASNKDSMSMWLQYTANVSFDNRHARMHGLVCTPDGDDGVIAIL